MLATLLSHELIRSAARDHWIRFLELLATIGLAGGLPTVYRVQARLHEAEEAACDACLVGTSAGARGGLCPRLGGGGGTPSRAKVGLQRRG